MNPPPPCHDGSKFHWEKNRGMCEASDLGPAVDNGHAFVIRSHRTGREILFTRIGIDRDGENEIVSMTYKAMEADFEVTVFND